MNPEVQFKLVVLKIFDILERPLSDPVEVFRRRDELKKLVEECAPDWDNRFTVMAAAFLAAVNAVTLFYAARGEIQDLSGSSGVAPYRRPDPG